MSGKRGWLTVALVTSALSMSSATRGAEECGEGLPEEIAPFIDKGLCAVQWWSGDLDKDGDDHDFIVLLDKKPSGSEKDAPDVRFRPLLILTSQRTGDDNVTRLEKRNDRLVPCETCEQTCGDPFDDVKVAPGTFTLLFTSGCTAWRGETHYTFGYSRKDKTWQLVRVKEEEIYTSDRSKGSTAFYAPPKDFGKIDLADFDPGKWKGQGPK